MTAHPLLLTRRGMCRVGQRRGMPAAAKSSEIHTSYDRVLPESRNSAVIDPPTVGNGGERRSHVGQHARVGGETIHVPSECDSVGVCPNTDWGTNAGDRRATNCERSKPCDGLADV